MRVKTNILKPFAFQQQTSATTRAAFTPFVLTLLALALAAQPHAQTLNGTVNAYNNEQYWFGYYKDLRTKIDMNGDTINTNRHAFTGQQELNNAGRTLELAKSNNASAFNAFTNAAAIANNNLPPEGDSRLAEHNAYQAAYNAYLSGRNSNNAARVRSLERSVYNSARLLSITDFNAVAQAFSRYNTSRERLGTATNRHATATNRFDMFRANENAARARLSLYKTRAAQYRNLTVYMGLNQNINNTTVIHPGVSQWDNAATKNRLVYLTGGFVGSYDTANYGKDIEEVVWSTILSAAKETNGQIVNARAKFESQLTDLAYEWIKTDRESDEDFYNAVDRMVVAAQNAFGNRDPESLSQQERAFYKALTLWSTTETDRDFLRKEISRTSKPFLALPDESLGRAVRVFYQLEMASVAAGIRWEDQYTDAELAFTEALNELALALLFNGSRSSAKQVGYDFFDIQGGLDKTKIQGALNSADFSRFNFAHNESTYAEESSYNLLLYYQRGVNEPAGLVQLRAQINSERTRHHDNVAARTATWESANAAWSSANAAWSSANARATSRNAAWSSANSEWTRTNTAWTQANTTLTQANANNTARSTAYTSALTEETAALNDLTDHVIVANPLYQEGGGQPASWRADMEVIINTSSTPTQVRQARVNLSINIRAALDTYDLQPGDPGFGSDDWVYVRGLTAQTKLLAYEGKRDAVPAARTASQTAMRELSEAQVALRLATTSRNNARMARDAALAALTAARNSLIDAQSALTSARTALDAAYAALQAAIDARDLYINTTAPGLLAGFSETGAGTGRLAALAARFEATQKYLDDIVEEKRAAAEKAAQMHRGAQERLQRANTALANAKSANDTALDSLVTAVSGLSATARTPYQQYLDIINSSTSTPAQVAAAKIDLAQLVHSRTSASTQSVAGSTQTHNTHNTGGNLTALSGRYQTAKTQLQTAQSEKDAAQTAADLAKTANDAAAAALKEAQAASAAYRTKVQLLIKAETDPNLVALGNLSRALRDADENEDSQTDYHRPTELLSVSMDLHTRTRVADATIDLYTARVAALNEAIAANKLLIERNTAAIAITARHIDTLRYSAKLIAEGVAAAYALAGVPQLPGKLNLTVSAGEYDGEEAMGVTFHGPIGKRTAFSGAVVRTGKKDGVAVGITVGL